MNSIRSNNELELIANDIIRWTKDIANRNSGWLNSARCFYEFFDADADGYNAYLHGRILSLMPMEYWKTFENLHKLVYIHYFNRFIGRIEDNQIVVNHPERAISKTKVSYAFGLFYECPESPTGHCQYDIDGGDGCIHCGEPSERK